MSNVVEVAPPQFAAMLAPAIDRLFRAGMAAGRGRGGAEISRRYGGPAATGYAMEFRTRLAQPGGRVTKVQFEAVTRYRDQTECRQSVEDQAAAGMLELGPDGELGTVRYHRADAHAAAWGAAGLTAAEMVALPAGPRRDAIEADTNERAAPPFVVLSAPRRLELLADLAALAA